MMSAEEITALTNRMLANLQEIREGARRLALLADSVTNAMQGPGGEALYDLLTYASKCQTHHAEDAEQAVRMARVQALKPV